MKTGQQQIPNTKAAFPLIAVGRVHAKSVPVALPGTKKSPLPFHLVDIRSRPGHKDDMGLVRRWMAEENLISIAKGTGELFNGLGPLDMQQGLAQKWLIFFYLCGRLLGFVRVIELAGNHWEIGSAISSPAFRRSYSGFNKLFNASSLLRISAIAADECLPVARVMIVTYNPGVADSIRKLQQSPMDRFFTLKDHVFDFSRIKELPAEKAGELVDIYGLTYKLLAGEIFFLFDVSACLLRRNEPPTS